MGTIRISEANFRDFIDRVRAGEELTLTDDERPVARVVPIVRRDPEQVRRAIREWRELTKGWSLGGLSVKELISEGRT